MRGTRLALFVAILLAAIMTLVGQGRLAPASSAILSEHELEEINAMSAQDQVMRLLERTINHYSGASEQFGKRANGWLGKIRTTPELTNLSNVAYFSDDLRVRSAALEVWRIEAGFRTSPEVVDQIIGAAEASPERKYFFLSQLGILGNRGMQPQKVFDTLMLHVHDPDRNIRSGAINGLAMLGTENTIAPLLEIFHSDTSSDLRERAACDLADSGMLSRELRKKAVPELIRFSQEPDLDQTTKKWVYQALREITQQQIGDDPSAWLAWYGRHGPAAR